MQALKTIVIGFGVLILIGFSVLVVALFQRGGEVIGEAGEPAAGRAVEGTVRRAFGDRSIPIPRGGRIEEMVAEGDRLILKLRLPEGAERLLVLDLDSGALLGVFEAEADDRGANKSGMVE